MPHPRRALALAAAALLIPILALAACGGSGSAKSAGGTPAPAQPKESAGTAATRQVTAIANRQYGRLWDELHPTQQAVVTRSAFEACAGTKPLPQMTDITVKETYDDPLSIASVPEKTSKAVTLSYRVNRDATSLPRTETLHEVAVGPTWRWTLEDSALDTYRAGRCP